MNPIYRKPRRAQAVAIAEAVQAAPRYPRSGRMVKGEAGRIARELKVPKRWVTAVSNGHTWSPLRDAGPAVDGRPLGAS